MSYLFNANGEYLSRTANLPDDMSFTICGWAKMTAYTFNNMIFTLHNARRFYYTDDGAHPLRLIDMDAIQLDFTTSPTAGNWYFWAVTCSSSAIKGYWAAETSSSMSDSVSGGAPYNPSTTELRLGLQADGFGYFNGYITAVKVWDVALTEAELLSEKPYRAAVKASPRMVTPLKVDADDDSGNGYHWTVTNATLESDEPSTSYLTDAPATGASPGAIVPTITL